MNCETACNKLKRKVPYSWDLNIYRGCEHRCKYCYAIYSHQYLTDGDYFKEIYVKTNVVQQLEKQLSSSSWKREIINIGGVTDSYQPAEAKYKIMPEILKLLIKYKTPCIISTKSDLILRDFELIQELSNITYVNVAATITTMDEKVRKLIEPGAVESLRRFAMLKKFRETNASLGLHVMPILPYITDNYENFHSLFAHAKDCGVDYVLSGTLYLRGGTRTVFFGFIKKEFPELYTKLQNLYKTCGVGKEYKNELYLVVNELRSKYDLSSSYTKPMKEKLDQNGYTQICL
ncbi:radical SAM protein [Clostridiaceae bacterium UIB06]|nr:radical SAM protein [Clostridiaceae bacterium UIB06]